MKDRIGLLKTDITKLEVDAIVNAANSSLMGGGGVDGAIHRAGGPAILEECRKIIARQGRCNTGEAVITTGGNLPAKFVIHTVGPVWNNGNKNEAGKLSACYKNSLDIAASHSINEIAFPNISTGIYGYPKREAATVAVQTVFQWIEINPVPRKVYFVCFDQENHQYYQELLSTILQ